MIWPKGASLRGISWTLLERELAQHAYTSTIAPVSIDEVNGFDAAVLVNSVGIASVASIDMVRFAEPRSAATIIGSIFATIPFDRI